MGPKMLFRSLDSLGYGLGMQLAQSTLVRSIRTVKDAVFEYEALFDKAG
jgi:hypothetical protein